MDCVSVIVPTYNRFSYIQNTIASIKSQTYTNIEIIVVNDGSTQKEYVEYDWSGNGIRIIHLDKNSKQKFGFKYPGGYVRNRGIDIASGKYIAFCDDDDIWFPNKLELQVAAMKATGCKMSSTDGLIGKGPFRSTGTYQKYNAEYFFQTLQQIYRNKGSSYLDKGLPPIWTNAFLEIHNCMITSSVIIDREIVEATGQFNVASTTNEDYEYWLRALKHTHSVYVPNVCFYYDSGHGDGQQY